MFGDSCDVEENIPLQVKLIRYYIYPTHPCTNNMWNNTLCFTTKLNLFCTKFATAFLSLNY